MGILVFWAIIGAVVIVLVMRMFLKDRLAEARNTHGMADVSVEMLA